MQKLPNRKPPYHHHRPKTTPLSLSNPPNPKIPPNPPQPPAARSLGGGGSAGRIYMSLAAVSAAAATTTRQCDRRPDFTAAQSCAAGGESESRVCDRFLDDKVVQCTSPTRAAQWRDCRALAPWLWRQSLPGAMPEEGQQGADDDWWGNLVEGIDFEYLRWLGWLLLPVAIAILVPCFMCLMVYASAIFLHCYKLRATLRRAYAASFWDGARTSLAAFWDATGWLWHGYEVRGLENIPDTGPALIIFYHGPVPLDCYYLLSKLLLHKKRDDMRLVGDRFIAKIPGMKLLCDVFHITPGSVDTCCAVLANGHLLAISPGGVREALFSDPSTHIGKPIILTETEYDTLTPTDMVDRIQIRLEAMIERHQRLPGSLIHGMLDRCRRRRRFDRGSPKNEGGDADDSDDCSCCGYPDTTRMRVDSNGVLEPVTVPLCSSGSDSVPPSPTATGGGDELQPLRRAPLAATESLEHNDDQMQSRQQRRTTAAMVHV